MDIHLRPELEELIRRDLQTGAYQTIDEFVERAISLLHEQEAWVAENRAEIAAKIEEGFAAAQRGEVIPDHEVRARMEEHKRVWLANRPPK